MVILSCYMLSSTFCSAVPSPLLHVNLVPHSQQTLGRLLHLDTLVCLNSGTLLQHHAMYSQSYFTLLSPSTGGGEKMDKVPLLGNSKGNDSFGDAKGNVSLDNR